MLDRELVITIPGDPAPKGSLKCIGRRGTRAHVLVEDNPASQPWRDKIAGLIRSKSPTPAERHQAVCAEVTFSIARPPSHYGSGRNAKRVLPSAPAFPVTRASYDVDKLLRLVLDALQDAGILPDDAAVIDATSRKRYCADAPLDAPGNPYDVLPWPGVRIRFYPA